MSVFDPENDDPLPWDDAKWDRFVAGLDSLPGRPKSIETVWLEGDVL